MEEKNQNENNIVNQQGSVEQNNVQNVNMQNPNMNSQNISNEAEEPASSILSQIAMGITIFQTFAIGLFIVALLLKIKIEESYNYILMIPGYLVSLILACISRLKYKDKLSKVTFIIDLIFIALKTLAFVGIILIIIIGFNMMVNIFVESITGCDG